jgi:hypothetical protein
MEQGLSCPDLWKRQGGDVGESYRRPLKQLRSQNADHHGGGTQRSRAGNL